VEEQRVNEIGDFDGSPAALGDGSRIEARIVVWERDNVLKVASSALFNRDGQWSVFILDGGRAPPPGRDRAAQRARSGGAERPR
jgi:HlyD family secretion protein